MKNKLSLCVVPLTVLAGCAASPADIAPAMVDTTQYQEMT